jgi:hypothetical protein
VARQNEQPGQSLSLILASFDQPAKSGAGPPALLDALAAAFNAAYAALLAAALLHHQRHGEAAAAWADVVHCFAAGGLAFLKSTSGPLPLSDTPRCPLSTDTAHRTRMTAP